MLGKRLFLVMALGMTLCHMLGCDGPKPIAAIAVPTGNGTEAVGKYEVHVVDMDGEGAISVQQATCGWLSVHPNLKLVSVVYVPRQGDGWSDKCQIVIVGYQADDKKDSR